MSRRKGRKKIYEYKYDKNGNQVSKLQNKINPVSGQPMLGIVALGNSTDNAVFELNEFDAFNRLKSTANEKGSANYKYKADGLRLSKTVNGAVTTHIWDGSNIVLELNGTGAIIDTYIRGINLIKSTVQGFYVYNAHGDVTARTNTSGTVTKMYPYDSFGVETDKVATDTNPFRYCGEYYDKETDTIYLRARRYSPTTGRFTTEDPIRSGLNWYTYCSGNPIAFIDPFGLAEGDLQVNGKNIGNTRIINGETYGSLRDFVNEAKEVLLVYQDFVFTGTKPIPNNFSGVMINGPP